MRTPNDAVAIAALEEQVRELRDDVEDLARSTKALVDAWNTATGMVKFVKLLATLVAAVGAIYVFFAHGFSKAP
jgi:hypothetical protein